MINEISLGIIYSSIRFLEFIETKRITLEEFLFHFKKFKLTDSQKIIDLVFKLHWVEVDISGHLKLSKKWIKINKQI